MCSLVTKKKNEREKGNEDDDDDDENDENGVVKIWKQSSYILSIGFDEINEKYSKRRETKSIKRKWNSTYVDLIISLFYSFPRSNLIIDSLWTNIFKN